jgi:uncharacterized protein (DUF983 family)
MPQDPDELTPYGSDVLRIKCPHCGEVNEFAWFAEIEAFACNYCEQPVEVEKRKQ